MERTSISPLVLTFHDRVMHVVVINTTVKYNQYCGESASVIPKKKKEYSRYNAEYVKLQHP